MMCFVSTVLALLSVLAMALAQDIPGIAQNVACGIHPATIVTGSDSSVIHGIVVPRQERETVTVTITTIPPYCQSLAPVPGGSLTTDLTGQSSMVTQAPETTPPSSTDNVMTTGASTLAGQIPGSVDLTATSTVSLSMITAATTSGAGSTASDTTTQSTSVTSNTMLMSVPPASRGSTARRSMVAAAGGLIMSLTYVILAN
ncbi:MAG: hypothetical protein M1816_005536 [Peltula sp. TS41687]|nr:MAG: hypothetical protein M1816_005536 [Peltula sp. TS41687]